MRKDGWVENPDNQLNMVKMKDGELTSMDNTRIRAAREADIKVEGNLRNYDAPLTPAESQRFKVRGKVPKTWGEAIEMRIKKQGGIFAKNNPNGTHDLPQFPDERN